MGFELSSCATDDEITTEDRDFIDNSNINDIYIPSCMRPPHGGFYVNDEPLYFDMVDEDLELDDQGASSQDEQSAIERLVEKKRKKKKELGELTIAMRHKNNLETDSTTSTLQSGIGAGGDQSQLGKMPPIFEDWSEDQLKSLKRCLRKFKNDWVQVQSFFAGKTVEELKKANAAYRRKLKADLQRRQAANNAEATSSANSEVGAAVCPSKVTMSSTCDESVAILSQTEDEAVEDTVADEDLTSLSELRQSTEDDSCSLASLMRSQIGVPGSSVSSNVVKEKQMAKAARDNKCEKRKRKLTLFEYYCMI